MDIKTKRVYFVGQIANKIKKAESEGKDTIEFKVNTAKWILDYIIKYKPTKADDK